MRRGALLAGNVPADASDDSNGSTIEFTPAVDFKRRGVASKIVVPGLPQQNQASNCDPALINAIARGRAWFDELAAGRARSLRDLAERDGITRRYIRYLPASGAAGPSIAVSDDDGLAFRTYNRRLVTQVSDEPRLAPRAWRDIVRRCFDDGPRLTGRRAHQD
jgi:hypothetical protein